MAVYESRTEVPAPAVEAFRWHARPGAFVRLSPPWNRVEVLEARGGIEDGARLVMRLGSPPLSIEWVRRSSRLRRRAALRGRAGVRTVRELVHEHVFEDAPRDDRSSSTASTTRSHSERWVSSLWAP